MRAWAWLVEEQDQELVAAWDRAQDALRATGVPGHSLSGVRIVAWQNRVLTLAGWTRSRRWYGRRYLEITQAIVQTHKDVVLVTPRVGATIARQIQREKQEER